MIIIAAAIRHSNECAQAVRLDQALHDERLLNNKLNTPAICPAAAWIEMRDGHRACRSASACSAR